MTKSRSARAAGVIACALAVAGIGAAAADAAKTVQVRGGIVFEPNQALTDTLRFAPGALTVRPNERITWVDRDRMPDPHTITIVLPREVPDRVNELFNCQSGPCALANQHLADPNDPNSDIARARVNVGKAGLNTRGDSLYLAPGGRISARVTARAGRRLAYICAIHPWMQGSIRVARQSRTAGAAAGGAGLTGRPH